MAEQNEQGLYQYFLSNDDNPIIPILTPMEIKNVSYPLTDKVPTSDLKSPKFDWRANNWIENDSESNGQKITQLESKIATITQNADATQKAIMAGSQQNQMVAEQMTNLQKMLMAQQQTTALIAQKLGAVPNAETTTTDDGGNK